MEDLSDSHQDDAEVEAFLRDPERIRSSLYSSGVEEWPWLPDLAQLRLHELSHVGLDESIPLSGAPPKQAGRRRPVIEQTGALPPVRMGDHRQVFWLDTNGPRTDRGYKRIKVLDKPRRTQTAIIAALTILEGQTVDNERLHEALSQVEATVPMSTDEQFLAAWFGELGDEYNEFNADLQYRSLHYAKALLRYYRPDLDDLPHERQLALIGGACKRVNELLTAARKLVAFLEYGDPDKDLREALEDANRDVTAAVLSRVEGLNSVKIAERFGLEVTEQHRDKREHRTAGQMTKRGNELLEQALGEEGWQKQAETMKTEAERWQKLSVRDKAIEIYAENHGVSLEEAQERVDEIHQRIGVYLLLSVDDDWDYLYPDRNR